MSKDTVELPKGTSGRDAAEVLRACGELARDILTRAFGAASVAGIKGRGNVVTETDFAAEQAVTELIASEFPEHAILAEERASEVRSDGWMWVIDPVDGTKNFSRGIPHFCFAGAMCYGGEAVLALTLQPITGEVFFAQRGEGSTRNGKPVRVSDVGTIQDSVVGIDLGYDNDRGKRQLELANALWPGVESIRVNGSAALGFAYVACGRWDLYLHSNLQPWDSAGGLLLIREAGGVVLDRDGGEATLWSEGIAGGTRPVVAEYEHRFGDWVWRETGDGK